MGKKTIDSYPAVKVMYAAHSVFSDAVPDDMQYANNKTNSFLKRCGADINKPKEQPLDISRIKEVAYAMFDVNSEKAFWLKLEGE